MHDASVYGSSHCLDLVDLEGLILLVSYISSDSYTFLSPLIQDSLSPGGGEGFDRDIQFRAKCFKVSHSQKSLEKGLCFLII